jgi:hypothetical protein
MSALYFGSLDCPKKEKKMKNKMILSTVLATFFLSTLMCAQSSSTPVSTAKKDPLKSSVLLRLLRIHSSPANAQASVAPDSAVLALAKSPHVYKFATVDFPGAAQSQATGSGAGTVVGIFQFDPSGGGSIQSFTYHNGQYRIYNVPGALLTEVLGINDLGQIVGVYADTSMATHGFIDTAGSIANVDFPGATQTVVTGVNVSGEAAGIWIDSSSVSHGFVENAGTFTSLDFPSSLYTEAAGINASGEVVGLYGDTSSVEHGFIYNSGTFTSLDVPLAKSTIAFGVNDAGVISGSYADAANVNHGFIYSAGVFNSVDVVGAADTQLTHLTNNGVVAGYFVDQLKETHGLTAH